MSTAGDSQLPPRVLPAGMPRSRGSSIGWILVLLFLIASLGLNVLLLCGGLFLRTVAGVVDSDETALTERFRSGSANATDRVAIVRIEGTILEGTLGFVHRQIDQAARDSNVKAVVLRIDSPGGSITASDDLHRRLVELRDGTVPRFKNAGATRKPLVVSMGAMAASGGYYVAMPAFERSDPTAKKLFAERTTISGSIGVYAAFPNVEGLAKTHGVAMEMIKAGAVKGSGSLFFKMTPQERQPWGDMVDHAYKQFLSIVEEGRPGLKGKLTEDLFAPRTIEVVDDRGNPVKDENGKPKTTTYTRQRADGGIFTADEAFQWGLIDAIGTLDEAVNEAARQAQLTGFRAVTYDRPVSLLTALTGSGDARAAPNPANQVLSPRLWYLAPGAELSAVMNAIGR